MHEGKAQEDDFRNICAIILNLKTKENSLINYAKAYASEGLFLYSPNSIIVQISYILSNLQYWRGKEARKIKIKLKEIKIKLS